MSRRRDADFLEREWIKLSVADACTGSDALAPMLFRCRRFVIVSVVHGADPEEK